MPSRSNQRGFKQDEAMKKETEALERSGRESRVEEEREKEADQQLGSGHRIRGSGSSVREHTYSDHGERGGTGHPKPKGD